MSTGGPAQVIDTAVAGATGFVAINAAPARTLTPETIERADLIVVNRLEYQALPELAHVASVVVTDGARGAHLLSRGEVIASMPGVRARVRSTVGAGDAFTAAVVLAIASGIAPEKALAIAARVGAEAVETEASQPLLAHLDTYAAHAA